MNDTFRDSSKNEVQVPEINKEAENQLEEVNEEEQEDDENNDEDGSPVKKPKVPVLPIKKERMNPNCSEHDKMIDFKWGQVI